MDDSNEYSADSIDFHYGTKIRKRAHLSKIPPSNADILALIAAKKNEQKEAWLSQRLNGMPKTAKDTYPALIPNELRKNN